MTRFPGNLLCSAVAVLIIANGPVAHASALYVGRSAGSYCYLTQYALPDKATTSVWEGSGWISGMAYDPFGHDLYYWRRYNALSYLYRDNEPGVYHGNGSDRDQLVYLQGTTNARYSFTYVSLGFDPLTRHCYLSFSNRSSGVRDPWVWIDKRHADTGATTNLYLASRSGREIVDVAVDPIGHYIYWTDEDAGKIHRRDLDGAFGVETLYTGLTTAHSIAIDRGSGKLFWSEYGYSGADSRIRSAAMGGGGTPVTLLTIPAGGKQLGDLSIDPVAGIVYFTEHDGSAAIVRQMTTSGADIQDFTSAAGSPVSGHSVHFAAATLPGHDFNNWITGFDLDPVEQGFTLDPDGDRLSNGLEAWLGSHPGQFNAGLAVLSTDRTTTSFTHPRNQAPPNDVSGYYEWTPNLSDWFSSGDGPVGGPTVTMTPSHAGTTTTVNAVASEEIDRLYLRAGVTQD